ncbi:MAG: hypothetical protein BWZ10_02725 [candidate division BRC1 bacterium ADurb.BinA364]|nr:MAG: hypothetical protein BWZ10_02725 [candidate division BRC1 bacterium ADurb.BinA364]
MLSPFAVRRVSDPQRHCVHGYFDLCPESPDGMRIVYCAFAGERRPPAEIMVAERDGGSPRPIGPAAAADSHSGAMQQWVDNSTAAYADRHGDKRNRTQVVSIVDGATFPVDAPIRMFSSASGLALGSTNFAGGEPGSIANSEVFLMDVREGWSRRLFGREQLLAGHPLRDSIDRPDRLSIKHTKWAPDGQRFFCVYHNEIYLMHAKEGPRYKSIYVADNAEAAPAYLCEFGHHPMWGGDSSFVYSNFRGPSGRQNLVANALDGSPPRTILENAEGVHSTLDGNGKRLLTDLFRFPEPGKASIALYDVESGSRLILATFDAPPTPYEERVHPHPVWSRDGKRVYFNGMADGVAGLFAVDLA